MTPAAMSGDELLRCICGDFRRAEPATPILKTGGARFNHAPEREPLAEPWPKREDAELYLLVGQAWELRDSPYCRDACQAIVDWHERRHLSRLERQKGLA